MAISKYLPRPAILVFAVVVFILALAEMLFLKKQPSSQASLIGGPFSLQSQSGKIVTEKDLLGHYSLLYFGYTQDKNYTTSELQVITAALQSLGPQSDRLTIFFITLDPERDSATNLGQFLAEKAPSVSGLTGTPEQITSLAKAYHVYFQKHPNVNQPGLYEIDYSPLIYLMGPDGNFIKPFAYTTDTKGLAEGLKKVLEQGHD